MQLFNDDDGSYQSRLQESDQQFRSYFFYWPDDWTDSIHFLNEYHSYFILFLFILNTFKILTHFKRF